MSLIKSLYESNDLETDFCVFKTVVPYFNSQNSFYKLSGRNADNFSEYKLLSEQTKKVFRDLVYSVYNELDLEKHEFLELAEFLRFSMFFKTDFLPLFRRYIYKHLNDYKFLQDTAYIHRNRMLLKIKSRLEFAFLLLGLNIGDKKKVYKLYKEGYPDAVYCYGIILHYEFQTAESMDIHLKNWNENKHSDSFYYYIYMLNTMPGNSGKSLSLYHQNWIENKHSESLFEYAHILGLGDINQTKQARLAHMENWIENKDMASLHEYAFFLKIGIGGDVDIESAKKFYYLNGVQNGFRLSLTNYAKILEKEKNYEEARILYERNWLENADITSLEKLIFFLEKGIGGEIDKIKADILKVELSE